MGNVDALKALYVALGGNENNFVATTNPEAINQIATLVSSLGGIPAANKLLPDVTATDNGDVLTVVDGAWTTANVPSELPSVTADDNGDVLKVVDGAWAKATS